MRRAQNGSVGRDEVVDEELDTPRPSRWPVYAIALLAAAVLVTLIARSQKPTRAPVATPNPIASPTSIAPPIGMPAFDEGILCPEADDGQNACSTVARVPAAFVRAV